MISAVLNGKCRTKTAFAETGSHLFILTLPSILEMGFFDFWRTGKIVPLEKFINQKLYLINNGCIKNENTEAKIGIRRGPVAGFTVLAQQKNSTGNIRGLLSGEYYKRAKEMA